MNIIIASLSTDIALWAWGSNWNLQYSVWPKILRFRYPNGAIFMACKIVPLLRSPARVLQGEVLRQPWELLMMIKRNSFTELLGFLPKQKNPWKIGYSYYHYMTGYFFSKEGNSKELKMHQYFNHFKLHFLRLIMPINQSWHIHSWVSNLFCHFKPFQKDIRKN